MKRPTHSAFTQALDDLREIGISECDAGAHFGIVSGRSNARWWLIPLASGRQARSGLDLFQPMSQMARVSKACAAFTCAVGLQRVVFRAGLRLSGTAALAATFPQGGAAEIAIFTGTDGPHRKTAIQFADAEAEILGYGKLSRSPVVIPWLEAEERNLREVAALSLITADTPCALELRQEGDATLLITDSRKGDDFRTPRALGEAHAAFLAELAARTAGADWSGYLASLRADAAAAKAVLSTEWQARLARTLERLTSGPALTVTLAHGDFTPWNSFLGQRLYVFDWEYAGRRAAGYDAIHFTLASYPNCSVLELRARAIATLARLNLFLTPAEREAALLAYLCDLSLLLARRQAEGLTRIDLWEDADRLGAAIDLCELQS